LAFDHRSIVECRPDSHNHLADPAYCKRRHFQSVIKNAAKSSGLSTAAVVADEIQMLSPDAQAAAPTFRSLQKTVRRVRGYSQIISLLAANRAALLMLYGFFSTQTEADFLKWDSGRASDRILLFTTNANLDTLQSSEHWFADGRFKSCPALFEKFFVIHGYKTDGPNLVCLPLVFVLMPNRIIQTYKRVFERLKLMRPGFRPTSFMTDFETGLCTPFLHSSPGVEKRGCYFHVRQAIQRKIQSKFYCLCCVYVYVLLLQSQGGNFEY